MRTTEPQKPITSDQDVLVMGGGATGHLAAAYFRMRFPDLKVAVVEGPHKNRPIVGESLVEVSVDFLLELGLGAYLVEKHYPKYGLTYYFKTDIDNPADRTYIVDEIPSAPPILSFQINRFTLDAEVRRRNAENGVALIAGSVAAVQLNVNGSSNADGVDRHSVTVQNVDGQKESLSARWLIDATGRNRFLAKQLHLQEKVKEQKDVYWFRLANFNPEILSHIRALKKEHRAYIPYFATHHFFGKGNWIWYIPMRSPENVPLVSIGITYRKDIYPHGEIHTMEQFLECIGREHPMLVELIRSGTVVDTNFYGSYMWECRQRYSPDRWYIIGDAGDTVDPLYSVGLALSTIQIRQVAAIIRQELNGNDACEFTKDLDTAIAAFQRSVTRDTTRLYQCMEDPYQCHLRIHLVVSKLFHLGLPLLLNDYLWDPLGVKLVNWFAGLEELESDSMRFQDLIGEVAANPKNSTLPNFIKVQSGASMNFGYYEHHREEDIPASLTRLSFNLARLRLALLSKLGWRGLLSFRQHRELLKDVMRALFLLPFRGSNLRRNWLVRRKFGPRDMRVATPDTSGRASELLERRSQEE
ncbi:MAG TPA: tryptophan 7-halogenase [Candidatus Acidoferrum sp.]|nr:tryptophan 7-halogenase [Candidatus Acidoferrum sp.]